MSDFSDLKGLPEGPWDWEIHDHSLATLYVKKDGPDFGHILSLGPCESCAKSQTEWTWRGCRTPPEIVARAIASIPDMLAEIERLRELVECKDCMEYAHKVLAAVKAENDRLRSLNAEMREEFERTITRLERCMLAAGTDKEYVQIALEKPHAILAKTEAP